MLGTVTFEECTIILEGYPFVDSIAHKGKILNASEIGCIDSSFFPPCLQVGQELVFISAEHLSQLEYFATRNCIKTSNLIDFWENITEPFLDAEFSNSDIEHTYSLLEKFCLERQYVDILRKKIKWPMIIYNFFYWENYRLGLCDVLTAMKPWLSKKHFTTFYIEAMRIALLPIKAIMSHGRARGSWPL